MTKVRALFYCGHDSRYGLAHLEPLLRSEIFQIEEVVLASYGRWKQFRSRLSGNPAPKSLVAGWAFRERYQRVLKVVRKLSGVRVRIVSDVNDPKEVAQAKRYDLGVCAAYPQIFGPALLGAPKLGAINFHPSYLPRCRGAHPVYWAIASGEHYSGVSCHMMEQTIDTGPLLAQRRIDFDKLLITYAQLYDLIEAETPLLCKDVERFFLEGRKPVPQYGDSSYFKNERDADRRVSFRGETVEQVSAKVRSAGAFAVCESGMKVFLGPLLSISSLSVMTDLQPGRIVELKQDVAVVMALNGSVTLSYRIASQEALFQRILKRAHLSHSLAPKLHIEDQFS